MQGKVFVDTNILVYLQSTTETTKRDISRKVVDTLDCVCSTQVLNELASVLSRKAGMPFEHVAEILDGTVQTCELVDVSYGTIQSALKIARKNLLGYYDSLIIASALESDCECLLSEDLSDGHVFNKRLTITNIYAHPDLID
jgi:predicted nucleic acid-binding protein